MLKCRSNGSARVETFQSKNAVRPAGRLIQGDSVRQIWGLEEEAPAEERLPVRRDFQPRNHAIEETADRLHLRLGEELEYARRMLDAMGDELSADPSRSGVTAWSLQSLDIVGQMLGHIAT